MSKTVPARCKKCGHEGSLPPPDPETGAPRFDCPICGEAALVVLDAAAPPPPKPELRWGIQPARPAEPVPTIYRPADPRPAGFVAGSIADLRALYHTLFSVLREGLLTAFLSLIVLTPVAVVLAGVGGVIAFVCCISFPAFFVAVALLWAGPLAAFGTAAMGAKPRLGAVLGRALLRSPLLALTVGGALIVGGLVFWLPLLILGVVANNVAPAGGVPDWAFFVAEAPCVVAVVWLYLRVFLVSHLVAVLAEPGDKRAALAEVPSLTNGRTVMLALVAGAPVLIQLAASPTPFTHELVSRALGPAGAEAVAVAAAILGWSAAILLGSALLASASAVILATPIPKRGAR